jgi:hypothetical protein
LSPCLHPISILNEQLRERRATSFFDQRLSPATVRHGHPDIPTSQRERKLAGGHADAGRHATFFSDPFTACLPVRGIDGGSTTGVQAVRAGGFNKSPIIERYIRCRGCKVKKVTRGCILIFLSGLVLMCYESVRTDSVRHLGVREYQLSERESVYSYVSRSQANDPVLTFR